MEKSKILKDLIDCEMIKDKDTIIVRDMYSQKTIYHGFAEYASYKALYSEVMHVEKRNEIYLIIVK